MNYTDVVEALSAKSGSHKEFVLSDITAARVRLSSADYEDICSIINNADSIDSSVDYLIETIIEQAYKRR